MPNRIPRIRLAPARRKRAPLTEDAHARRKELQRAAWRKLRAAHLARYPLCHDCEQHGRLRSAKEVHHIISRQADPSRSHDPDNLMSLCRECHAIRTARGE